MEMDPKWVEAVKAGDVEFWRERVGEYKKELEEELVANNGESDYQYDYTSSCFLSVHHQVGYECDGNILHLAADDGEEKMFDEIISNLPNRLVHLLLTQYNSYTNNPLHLAARKGHERIVKMIMGFYVNPNSNSEVINLEPKPWLALDVCSRTPLHTALNEYKEASALEMLTHLSDEHEENNKDLEKLCNMADVMNNTPLLMTMRKGLSPVALHILRFAPSYSLRDDNGCTPFHYVARCSEEVLKLLLEKHPDLIRVVDDDGSTMVHKWILVDKNLWPLEYIFKSLNDSPAALLLKTHLAYFCYACGRENYNQGNVFHLFAQNRMFGFSTQFACIYREVRAKEQHQLRQLPWLLPNKSGISALEIAMTNNKITCDEYERLKSDLLVNESAMVGESELVFAAINKELYNAASSILYVQQTYGWWCLCPPQGPQFWHDALKFSEEAAIWMVEKIPALTTEHEQVKHILHSASEAGAARFIEWMLKKDPSVLKLVPKIWIEACKKGHFQAVMAFINHCPYFREICIQHKDTPLHHIKFEGYRQYLDFLKDPIILALKNFQDLNGDTPLHKSIKNHNNLLLTEVLLTTDDVIRSIEDNDQKTAMDLLVKACKGNREWQEMCKRNGILPGLKTTYFQDKTNLLDVRNTLLVVAALLATITFTAGFTLPGGVQSDSSGKPILGNKAAFLVFLLSDVLAMCSSMLVLVCLLWSMLCDHNRSLYLIDKSMPVLLVALCSTLVAFMTGVYVVMPSKSLWASILILGICSIIVIISIPWIINKIMDSLNLEKPEEYSTDEMELMERGEATSLVGNRNLRIEERTSSSIGGGSPQQH